MEASHSFDCNMNVVVVNSCNILSSVNNSPANKTTAATMNNLPIAISVSNKVFIFASLVAFVVEDDDDFAGRSIDLAAATATVDKRRSSSRCSEDDNDDEVISPCCA